jgi:CDGSH-type Zn-finger protein
MNKQGVTFKPEEIKKEAPKPTFNPMSGLTAQLSEFNRPRCGCGKSKNPPYCDGSHAR